MSKNLRLAVCGGITFTLAALLILGQSQPVLVKREMTTRLLLHLASLRWRECIVRSNSDEESVSQINNRIVNICNQAAKGAHSGTVLAMEVISDSDATLGTYKMQKSLIEIRLVISDRIWRMKVVADSDSTMLPVCAPEGSGNGGKSNGVRVEWH